MDARAKGRPTIPPENASLPGTIMWEQLQNDPVSKEVCSGLDAEVAIRQAVVNAHARHLTVSRVTSLMCHRQWQPPMVQYGANVEFKEE